MEDTSRWKERKRLMYQWAKERHAKHLYPERTRQFLDAIITCCNMSGKSNAPIESILDAYEKQNGYRPSSRTAKNHIATLVTKRDITRSDQLGYNRPVTTRLVGIKSVIRSGQLLHTNLYLAKSKEDIAAALPASRHAAVDNSQYQYGVMGVHVMCTPENPYGQRDATPEEEAEMKRKTDEYLANMFK